MERSETHQTSAQGGFTLHPKPSIIRQRVADPRKAGSASLLLNIRNFMENLLIIHQGALGDFVATFPAIIRLKRHFHQVDVLCQSKLGKLACLLNIAEKHFPLESAAFASLYTDAVNPAVQNILTVYHAIVLFSYSEQLELTIRKISGRKVRRIRPRAEVSQPVHITEHILSNLVKYKLLEKSDSDISHTDKRDRLYDPGKIWLHPGSGSRRKNWGISNFMEIERMLRSEDMKPEFILGPGEHFLKEILEKNHSRVHIISDLTEIVSFFKKAGGFIGNDSGLSHLAAFMGVPTVAIFGPSDPTRWQPVGQSVKIVRPSDLDCSPCFETNKDNCDKMECFDRTTPEKVLRR